MKTLASFLIICLMAVFTVNAQGGTIQIEDFDNLSIQSNAEITIFKSSKDQIVTNLSDEQMGGYKIENRNNTLFITYTGSQEPQNAKMRIYTSDIDAIQVDGKAVVDISDRFEYFDKLMISAKNGATVELNDNKVKSLYANTTGDCKVNCRKSKFTQLIIDGEIQQS